VSQLISAQQRNGDLLARISGDQFGILLKDCSAVEVEEIANQILDTFRHHQFLWKDESFDVRVSIGLITISREIASLTALISSVETAVNVAQERGGNQLHFSDSSDSLLTRRLDQSHWVNRINSALRDNCFELHYQTIAPLRGNSEQGDHYEVLVRMISEDGSVVAPDKFLTVAESYLMSPLIDRWVIKNLVDMLSQHPQQLQNLAVCSINLSGQSVGNDGIFDFIIKTFDESNLPPEKFCFEITETTAIAQHSLAVDFIKREKQKGFRFSLDDFGAALSSFAYLKSFPVDYLKIDGQFVKNMDTDAIDHSMVKSITEVGKLMGIEVIAEFVENGAIQDLLVKMGVDFAQGYHIAKPRKLSDKF
jgi:EAL domain-containing protein (putative c-di-GMP-specific phosphodiesterase class I)